MADDRIELLSSPDIVRHEMRRKKLDVIEAEAHERSYKKEKAFAQGLAAVANSVRKVPYAELMAEFGEYMPE